MGCRQSSLTSADNRLTVIVVHYNPQQFKRRAFLMNECLKRLSETQRRIAASSDFRLNIVAVELLYKDKIKARKSEITLRVPGVRVIRRTVDSQEVMWSKEQLINLAIRTLPDEDEKYVAWIDSDIAFHDDSWVSSAITTLSQHPLAFGQLWSTCDMLGPNDEKTEMTVTSFAQQKANGRSYISCSNRQVDDYWHPGFAWCATMSALRKTEYLIDKTLGSADRHMAMSFLGRARETVPDNVHANYLEQVMKWQDRVLKNNIQLVGIQARIKHYWHGPLHRRKYMGRWNILARHKFDPNKHLKLDQDRELYIWDESCPEELQTEIDDYFLERQEDSAEEDHSSQQNSNGGAGDGDEGAAGIGCFFESNTVSEMIVQAVSNMIEVVAISSDQTNDLAAPSNNDQTPSADPQSLDFYA